MKDDLTYYEMLDVASNASFEDIRSAFREIQSIYDKDSLSTYSLFSSAERAAILDQAEKAFRTLMDSKKRNAYDQGLLGMGRLSEDMLFSNKAKTPVPVFNTGTPGKNGQVSRTLKEKSLEPDFISLRDTVLAKDAISGGDLKQLRNMIGITLSDIFEMSRVSVATLEAIESDSAAKLPPSIYLKGFLKSYAECLNLDHTRIVPGYMAHLSQVS